MVARAHRAFFGSPGRAPGFLAGVGGGAVYLYGFLD